MILVTSPTVNNYVMGISSKVAASSTLIVMSVTTHTEGSVMLIIHTTAICEFY